MLIVASGSIGAYLGQAFIKDKELRDVRRSSYVRWMQAARNIATWIGEEPATGEEITFPVPERLHALNDAMAEMGVVGSRRVIGATDAFMDTVEAEERLGKRVMSARDFMTTFDKATRKPRRGVLREMRRDLFPWWRRRQAKLSVDSS